MPRQTYTPAAPRLRTGVVAGQQQFYGSATTPASPDWMAAPALQTAQSRPARIAANRPARAPRGCTQMRAQPQAPTQTPEAQAADWATASSAPSARVLVRRPRAVHW